MQIVIPGNPIAKARPKFAVRGKHAMAYDPQAELVKSSKKDLLFRCDEYFILNDHQIPHFKASFRDPKHVSLCFYIPIAESDAKHEKNAKLWGPEFSGEWHSKKDLDNFVKWTCDIANGILWHDDSQIVELHAYQLYSEKPCTIITVEDIKIIMNEETEKMMRIFSPAAIENLECDISCLRVELESFRMRTNENREQMQDSAAKSLKAFAAKYCDSLKKMLSKGVK